MPLNPGAQASCLQKRGLSALTSKNEANLDRCAILQAGCLRSQVNNAILICPDLYLVAKSDIQKFSPYHK
jgi:hypothetical protein